MLGLKQPWRETFRTLRGTSTFRFFATAFVAYVVWSVAYEQALKPKTMLDEVVIGHMVSATECVMQALEWPVGTYPQAATHRNRVGVAGHVGVRIGAPCDGVALFALFTIFVLAFPGAVLPKIWFIPAGIAVLHAANILRVVLLVRIQVIAPEWLEFNHDYTFTVFVYGLVFALWHLWTVWGQTPAAKSRMKPIDK